MRNGVPLPASRSPSSSSALHLSLPLRSTPRRTSTAQSASAPFFPPLEFSVATARLFVVLCLTWLLFCASSRTSRVHAAPRIAVTHELTRNHLGEPSVMNSQRATLSTRTSHQQETRRSRLHAVERITTNDPAAQMRYPRNLHRIYDGSWKISSDSSLPFSLVPPAPPRAAPTPAPVSRATSSSGNEVLVSNRAAVTNASNGTSTPETKVSTKYRFTERKGFALLTAENFQTSISALHIVMGELLFRDGKYRTSRDIALRTVGVYEWKTGTIFSVGDPAGDSVPTVLGNLYETLLKQRIPQELNMSKENFISEMHKPLVRLRKTNQIRRPVSKNSVLTLCPFEAVFKVKQDVYMDKAPVLDLGSPIGVAGSVGIENTVGASLRYSEIMQNGEQIAIRGAQSRLRQDQGSNPQEEMVKMSGTFTSEQCNTKMDVELQTLDTEMLFVKAINYTLLVTVVAFTQVIVLIRQMEMTSTQAGASRVSLMTVGLQAVADSYLCLGHLTLGIAVHTLFNAFATAAFFKFICFSIFLMRWMLLIWKARRPSGFSEGWEAMRRELSMLYSRFYLSLLLGLFLLYQLKDHIRIFIFALYSFWVPQIVLNIVEDHRRPLLPMYIVGTSVTRLAIPLYFWGCPNNFLHIHPLPKTVASLVGWLALQSLILLSQYRFGPRWFIPKALLPEKYDYYRPITLDDDEDDLEAQNKDAGEGDALVAHEPRRECCICMECVLVHSPDRMVTPCGHFFHSECLLKWLDVRLECALCRRPVPPP